MIAGRRRFTPPPMDPRRLRVFVPAIMSVGMLFWLVTLVRDAVRWRFSELEAQRSTIAGRRTAAALRPGSVSTEPDRVGFRQRMSYLVTATFLYSVAAYIFVGSVANYIRDDGYVEGEVWLLAPAVLASVATAVAGTAAILTWLRWPPRTRWVLALVARSPLSRMPLDRLPPGVRPGWLVSAAVLLLPVVALLTTFFVATGWEPVESMDEQLSQLLDVWELDELEVLDPIGSTLIGVALAALVGVSSLRCRPLAVAYPVSVLLGFAVTNVTKAVVARPRPQGGAFALRTDSFPSGHLVQATLIAGLIPLAVAALTGSKRWIWPLRFLLGLGVFGAGLHRIDDELHFASDVIASVFFGLALVVLVQWIIDHENWHAWCRGCPWGHRHPARPTHGVLHVHLSLQRVVRIVAHTWAAAAVIGITVLSLTWGVPTHADGGTFGPDAQVPVQLALAGVASFGALISWRWDAPGAVMLAFAGTGMGVFAAIEYSPLTAFGLGALFIAPSVLLWLGWQHQRSMAEIMALATITALLLSITWAGATYVNDAFFGPTHPDSEVVARPIDEVDWMWMGALTGSSIDVVAGVDGDAGPVVAVATDLTDGTVHRSAAVRASDHDVARLRLEGLSPGRPHALVVEVDGEPDRSRGTGSFTTAPEGPASFRFVAGSCARTNSNGAVFDAMTREEPLFYLAVGDIHYRNIDDDDENLFRGAYRQLLRQPGQAELYRNVPISYTWDDHDYGPNDSDADAAGQSAARAVYREMVPYHDLVAEGDAPIHQAYTIGRVRFVLTDTRSERTDESMLGQAQLDWLIGELVEASRTHGLVVWANSVPWVSASSDSWGGWPRERRRIADALAEADVDNLVMISGDAHMVALDDGTSTDFSTAGAGGFPLLQAAALDRPGNVKGGPYSDGAFPGGGQYGVIDIDDDGETIEVTLSGRTWDGVELLSGTFTFGD